jgi:hypothetical protein
MKNYWKVILLLILFCRCGQETSQNGLIISHEGDQKGWKLPLKDYDRALEYLGTEFEKAGLTSSRYVINRIRLTKPLVKWEPYPFVCGGSTVIGCVDYSTFHDYEIKISWRSPCLGDSAFLHEVTHIIIGGLIDPKEMDFHHQLRNWWDAENRASSAFTLEQCPNGESIFIP